MVVEHMGWWHGIWTKFISPFFTLIKKMFGKEKNIAVISKYPGWWHLGKVGRKPATQICADIYITNISSKPLIVCKAYLTHIVSFNGNDDFFSKLFLRPIYWFSLFQGKHLGVILYKEQNSNIYGKDQIPPNETTDGRADFFIEPTVSKEGKHLIATLILEDQFGNKHSCKDFIFRPPAKKNNERNIPAKETVYKLNSKLEKDIVSILKSEVCRYEGHGRKSGGLGSLKFSHNGHEFRSIPSDVRKTDCPDNQSIVNIPEKTTIKSDNLDSITSLFNGLSNESDKDLFKKTLIDRLKKDCEYTSVGYFIFYTLLLVEDGRNALMQAKNSLYGDDEFAFSNILLLVDRLLLYKHDIFSDDLLGEIEKSLEGVKEEETFKINERIVAIRTYRINSNGRGAKNKQPLS